jgi:hypothetical protein
LHALLPPRIFQLAKILQFCRPRFYLTDPTEQMMMLQDFLGMMSKYLTGSTSELQYAGVVGMCIGCLRAFVCDNVAHRHAQSAAECTKLSLVLKLLWSAGSW